MVYGCPLTLPGQFLEGKEPPTQPFVQRLQQIVQGHNVPTRPLTGERSSTSLPRGLMEATYVYVRRDGHWPPPAQVRRTLCGHLQGKQDLQATGGVKRGHNLCRPSQASPRHRIHQGSRVRPAYGSLLTGGRVHSSGSLYCGRWLDLGCPSRPVPQGSYTLVLPGLRG
jgi:hypothetical protein